MKVYSLSTARAGSKSPPNKNLLEIEGNPVYLFNILESINTPEIICTYLSTDIPEAIENKAGHNYKVIIRPPSLTTDEASHMDVIYHGLMEIEKDIGEELDYLVVMLGNTINMCSKVVKEGLEKLEKNKTLDSVITVIKVNHFNPIRAYVVDEKNKITTYLPQDIIKSRNDKIVSDKNSAGDILFQNGLWIIRRDTIIKSYNDDSYGLLPFRWFGNNISYIYQDPSLQEIDDQYQVNLLKHRNRN